jgi:2-polyprenyl-6-methoxyphenol hydroxylase-like FAD-dependent oxidoreductase
LNANIRMDGTDVLIVGAGPTGLVLALLLTRLGIRVRIVDKAAEPGTTSRALAVQARTLELYQQIGLSDAVVNRGRKMTTVNLWTRGRHVAHVIFGDMGRGLSPFPYALIYPQDEHERLLIDRLATAGVQVERQTELVAFEQTADGVRASLRRQDGGTHTCEATYLAGCDGAHSLVREGLGIGFPGGTYDHLFYVADVEAGGAVMNGELHAALDTTDFLIVFPLKDEGRARLIGTVQKEPGQQDDHLSWDDVSQRVLEWLRIDVEQVHWFSTYRVHHRVADRFQKGRAFLLGDAGHIHSPVGGQGMNTGIGDAVNLAWKIADVTHGRADASLLDSYEPERIAFARHLVATTDQAFTGATSDAAIARHVRLDILPAIAPAVFAFGPTRRLMFRTISQIAIQYRGSSLSKGRAGDVHGGDRLPWVPATRNDRDNFAPLTSLTWQVHVYGDATSGVRSACEERDLPLHVFPWRKEMSRAGLQRNAVYLVRPDGYVALAEGEGSAEAITSYLDARALGSKRQAHESAMPGAPNFDLLRAIADKRLVEFTYGTGRARLAEPHDYGIRHGVESLLVFQLSGDSQSGASPGWKELDVSKIRELRVTEHLFAGTRSESAQRHRDWDTLFARVN